VTGYSRETELMCVGLHNRMSTSKLTIDPSRVAAAEKDDWAKFVFFFFFLARCYLGSTSHLLATLLFFFWFILSARLPGSRTIISSMRPSCEMVNY
jgi:hypothetical protein